MKKLALIAIIALAQSQAFAKIVCSVNQAKDPNAVPVSIDQPEFTKEFDDSIQGTQVLLTKGDVLYGVNFDQDNYSVWTYDVSQKKLLGGALAPKASPYVLLFTSSVETLMCFQLKL